jgi:pimeloyl-ACP methyl ester carboxylesterase
LDGRLPSAWHAIRDMHGNMKPKVVFVHGMFLNALSWERWVSYLEKHGFICDAPSWPCHEGKPPQLRAHIPAGLGSLSLPDVLSHYRRLLRSERVPPVLIGHSLGGLLVQILVSEGLASAGVVICPMPPNHMLGVNWEFLGDMGSFMDPPAGEKHIEISADEFQRVFANTLPESHSRAAYERYVVPESRQVLLGSMGVEGTIDVSSPHVPLLFIGAEKDVIIPPSLVRQNAQVYTDERSRTEYVGFPGRGHFICGEPRWEQAAKHIVTWLRGHLRTRRARA